MGRTHKVSRKMPDGTVIYERVPFTPEEEAQRDAEEAAHAASLPERRRSSNRELGESRIAAELDSIAKDEVVLEFMTNATTKIRTPPLDLRLATLRAVIDWIEDMRQLHNVSTAAPHPADLPPFPRDVGPLHGVARDLSH